MRIINLTHHAATQEQIDVGVIDLPAGKKAILAELLTFETLPTLKKIQFRAEAIAELAATHDISDDDYHAGIYPTHAMIGGAPWLMSALESTLMDHFVIPIYAFSLRESIEQIQPDNSVRKINIFKHFGFVGNA